MSSWHSLHVHHHDPATEADLVLDAVRPAFAAVAVDVDAVYFGRHWRRGPHLRLNLLVGEEKWPRVRAVVTEIVAAHQLAHPSTAELDEEALAPLHSQLAVLEVESGPLHPFHPDNSIVEEPYDQRLHVFTTVAASEAMAAFAADTTEQTFRMYEYLRGGGALAPLALDLMWATASVASIPFVEGGSPIERGMLSLRSHADAFISRTADPDAYRAAFVRTFDRQREALTARLAAVEAAVEGGGPELPLVTDWVAAVREHQPRLARLTVAGELLQDGALAPRLPTRRLSDFHGLLLSGHGHEAFRADDIWFTTFKTMLNYLYLQLGRLGLRPDDRALLCHLAVDTIEAAHGITAIDAFNRYVVSADTSWRSQGEAWVARATADAR
ncbi:thiopeptide maturation pyridine synthase [Lentzea sp. E54]|uniref:thiopeptide maturation pyridine synthase n=1 Tax=Lentzea xerophila TaxID=3435883 RepID=UPI003DA42B30